MNTDTPQTDAETWRAGDLSIGSKVCADFARKLERERDEAREQRDRLAEACDQYSEDEILCKLQEITEQRDRLATILQNIRSGFGGQIPDQNCDCGDCEFLIKIDNALQYITKPKEL